METSTRRKLFDMLNRAKADLEEQKSDSNSETASVVSTNSVSSILITFNLFNVLMLELSMECCQVNGTALRGAGRGRYFRPDLLDKVQLNSSGEDLSRPSTSSSGTVDIESSENAVSPQGLKLKDEKKGKKGLDLSTFESLFLLMMSLSFIHSIVYFTKKKRFCENSIKWFE